MNRQYSWITLFTCIVSAPAMAIDLGVSVSTDAQKTENYYTNTYAPSISQFETRSTEIDLVFKFAEQNYYYDARIIVGIRNGELQVENGGADNYYGAKLAYYIGGKYSINDEFRVRAGVSVQQAVNNYDDKIIGRKRTYEYGILSVIGLDKKINSTQWLTIDLYRGGSEFRDHPLSIILDASPDLNYDTKDYGLKVTWFW